MKISTKKNQMKIKIKVLFLFLKWGGVRAARSPVFYGSSRILDRFSRLPFETNTGDTFCRILTSLNFVA